MLHGATVLRGSQGCLVHFQTSETSHTQKSLCKRRTWLTLTDYRLKLYISALSTLELLWICPACDPWLCCACFSQSLLSPPPQGNPRFSASESGQITSAHLGNHVSGTSYGQIFNQSILQIAGWFQLKITSALPPHYVPRPQLSLDASPGNCGTIPRPHLLRQTNRLIFIKHRMMLSSCS